MEQREEGTGAAWKDPNRFKSRSELGIAGVGEAARVEANSTVFGQTGQQELVGRWVSRLSCNVKGGDGKKSGVCACGGGFRSGWEMKRKKRKRKRKKKEKEGSG